MKTLVLGGTGFIGSYVVDRLLASGHEVRVFSRTPEQFRSPLAEVDYRLADFNDIPALEEALSGVDVVFHLISTTTPATSNQDQIFDIESNLVATVKLIQLIRDSGVRRLVYLSSGGTVYGIPEMLPIPEEHPLRPICSYGIVKVAVENYLHMFQQLHGLDYVVLRASNPYGERQGHYGVQGVIGTFLNKTLKGEELEIWGDGGVVRDFVYVKDLAALCVAAAESDKVGVYNGGSGRGHSIEEVRGYVEEAVGRKLLVIRRESRNFDVPKVVLDIKKASHAFNWRPTVDLATGIKITWDMMTNSAKLPTR
ncbi:MAG: NAD-dependent epimerase/dehydratase family protein [Desulfobulbaceae bacterium]|nr:NAD-dependent epimerase/dehydratase family protein [Desulfobulbaceae bacterium]